ncbi:hypothetical protein, partial [Mucilaginibacter sp.]|uniref:hypothetical protein n=1 Tax=Mucilaginibacter sp. TaxID=1882438 RepID=UPI0035BC72CC
MANNSNQSPFDDDATKQVNTYLKAFETLRVTIIGLNKPVTDISKNIKGLNSDLNNLSGAVNQMAKDSQAADGASNKLTGGLEKLTKTHETLTSAIKIAKKAFTTFEATLTAGLSLIIAYGPEILNIVNSWIKGKETISQAALSINTLNKALGSSEVTNAAKQFNELKINIGLAKEGTLSKKEVLKQYNDTLGKTMGHANSLNEADAKMVKDGPAYIKMVTYKAAAQLALQEAAKKAFEAEQIQLKPDDEVMTFWDKTVDLLNRNAGAAGTGSPGIQNIGAQADKDKAEKVKKRKNEATKLAIKDQNDFEKIAERYQKLAAALSKDSKMDFYEGSFKDTPGTSKAIKQHTDYLSQIEKLRRDSVARQLQLVYEGYGAEAKAETDRYGKELAGLQDLLKNKHITQQQYNRVSAQLQNEHHANIKKLVDKYNAADAEKTTQAQNELVNLQIKGMKEGADKKIAQLNEQHQESLQQITRHENELTDRKAKLEGQIILTLAANPGADISMLQKQLESVNELYKINGDKKIELAKQTQQEIEKIKAEEAHSKLIDANQNTVDTAKGASAKLDAQKKLIFDKYQYEIDLAKGNDEKIAQLTSKRDQETTQLIKQGEKQRADITLQTAQTVASAAISIVSTNIKAQSDARIRSLEKDKVNELNNKSLTSAQRKAIEDKYQKKENQEKLKAFKATQKVQISEALINGAIGIQKTIAEWGMPFALPFMVPAVAQTAAQIAIIASQKPPQFAKGGHFVSDGRGALLPG